MRDRLRRIHPLVRVVLGAIAGMALAIGIGLIAVNLASGQGFGDLAAASVTIVFGLPAGALLGGLALYWLGRDGGAAV